MTDLIIVSNREITKITLHTQGGGAFYHGRVLGDAETQPRPGEGKRANLDIWSRDHLEGMLSQRDCEAASSGNRNLQQTIPDPEPVAGDELLSKCVRGPSSVSSTDRLLSSRQYSGGPRYRAELVVARRIVLGERVVGEERKLSQRRCSVGDAYP